MTDATLLARGAAFEKTDEGNARRLQLYAGDQLRYVKEYDRWHRWDDRRWLEATPGDMLQVARRVVGKIYEEAATLSDASPKDGGPSPREAHAAFAIRSSSAKACREMVFLARGDERLWRPAEDFDTNPWLLNCLNGTVDLRTGALKKPHDREDYITKLVPHNYVPSARADRFRQLVARTFQSAYLQDVSVVGAQGNHVLYLVQKLLGVSLIGENLEQVIVIVQGDANTGKSKLVEVPAEVLGPDYTHKSKNDLISRKSRGHHDSEVTSIVGARLVTISETSSTFALDESRVKELTGDARVTERTLFGKRETNPRVTWLIWVITNEFPTVQDWDDAVARRVIMLPAGPPLPSHERVKDLTQQLVAAEAEGVLAYLVGGAVAWYRDWQASLSVPHAEKTGLLLAPSVTVKTSEYAASQDHVGQFIEEVVELLPGAETPSAHVFAAFKRWRGPGEASNRNLLYARVKKLKGVEFARGRTFKGVRLRLSDQGGSTAPLGRGAAGDRRRGEEDAAELGSPGRRQLVLIKPSAPVVLSGCQVLEETVQPRLVRVRVEKVWQLSVKTRQPDRCTWLRGWDEVPGREPCPPTCSRRPTRCIGGVCRCRRLRIDGCRFTICPPLLAQGGAMTGQWTSSQHPLPKLVVDGVNGVLTFQPGSIRRDQVHEEVITHHKEIVGSRCAARSRRSSKGSPARFYRRVPPTS